VPNLSNTNLNRTTIHDVAVEVVLSSQRPSAHVTFPAKGQNNSSPTSHQIFANMIISVWFVEEMRYYTITFTSSAQDNPGIAARDSSRTVDKTSNSFTYSPRSTSRSSSSSGPHSGRWSRHSSNPPSKVSSPSYFVPNFPPQGPPVRNNLTSAHTILQKVTRLKDALLSSMSLPCYAMWRDESIGILNNSLMKFVNFSQWETGSHRDFLSKFKVYTESFSRLLDVDEYPIVIMCRTQKALSRRIGLKDSKNGAPRIFDASGEIIRDEETGEFLGVVLIMKDVTGMSRTTLRRSHLLILSILQNM